MQTVNARFRNIQLNLAVHEGFSDALGSVFQLIRPNAERKLSTHAKRMLKKAEKQNWAIRVSEEEGKVLDIVRQELSGKIEGINARSMGALEKLMLAAKREGYLKVFELPGGGAIACLESAQQCLYLKGTTRKEEKDAGGMYFLMQTAISQALAQGKIFDFGGSNAEGVKRFNHALGGQDVHYATWIADGSPIWFKFAKRIRKTWKKFY
jgi:hypothetical protein